MTLCKSLRPMLGAALAAAGVHAAATHAQTGAEPAAGVKPRASALAPDPEAVRRAQVLARFAGGEVTVGELEDAIAGKAPGERARLASDVAARTALLRDMIDYELLRLEAERRGYARNPVVRHRTARAAVAEFTREELVPDSAAIPDAAVRARFDQRASQLQLPSMRRASLLVVATRPEALALREQLAGRPRSEFRAAVLSHSIDAASKAQAGQLGFFDDRGRRAPGRPEFAVPEPVVAAVFATEHGQISEPFAYAGGQALVLVTGVNRASNPTFEQLAPELREELAEEALVGAIDALVDRQRAALKPVVSEGSLDLIQLDTALEGIPTGESAAPPDPSAPARYVEPDGV